MKVKKIAGMVIIECDESEGITEDMIDDISRMNQNAEVMIYHTDKKKLILQGDTSEKIFDSVKTMMTHLEELLRDVKN